MLLTNVQQDQQDSSSVVTIFLPTFILSVKGSNANVPHPQAF